MNLINPWKTLCSRVAYENNWLKILEDKVIRPDGKEGIYGTVSIPDCVFVAAVTDDDEVYLVGQFRYPIQAYSWELIAGSIEKDESPLEAAQRELLEEAGIVAKSWQQCGAIIQNSPGLVSHRVHYYIARDLTVKETQPEPSEILQIKKVPLNEAVNLIDSGEIADSLTSLGIFKIIHTLYMADNLQIAC